MMVSIKTENIKENADDGKWYFTEGQGSRPFLYETRNALEAEVLKIAKEVFSNA